MNATHTNMPAIPGGPAACRKAQVRRRGAFTLVEILVVVSIMGIASAVIVPQMLNTGSLTTQSAARMIIADLLYAQNEAIGKQAARRVVFDPTNNSYSITDSQGAVLGVSWKQGGSTAQNYIVSFANDRRFAGVTLGTVAFNNTTTIEFDALGSPNTGGTIDLAGGSAHYRITVTPFTGRVTIAPVTGD